MINIIAAVGKNNELGLNNKLIWNIPEDLQYFKRTTIGKTVVMGRKTYESIGKPLSNRNNIVLTRKNIEIEGVNIVKNYEEVLKIEDETFIIGGASIYELFLPYADNIYLTEIEDTSECDSYFPSFNKELYEKEIVKKNNYNGIDYSFVIYKRVK